MRRIAAITCLMLLAGIAASITLRHDRVEQVYTVDQVMVGLARSPAAWAGRVVAVRGRADIALCHGGQPCLGATPRLIDLASGRSLRLNWRTVSPLLTTLLSIPFAGAVAAQRVGGVGTYRLRLVHATHVFPAAGLPGYYPYTNKVVLVQDDRGVLVNGLN